MAKQSLAKQPLAKQPLSGEAPIEPNGKTQTGFGFLHDLYKTVWRIAGPLLPIYLQRRARRGKEDPARLGERFGTGKSVV